jgi:hypothetical protein
MKKLLIASLLVFSMIFTAGLASAISPSVPTITTLSGDLWFVSSSTGIVAAVPGALLTLTKVVPPKPNTEAQPVDIWTGTITFPGSSGTPGFFGNTATLTVDIAAFQGPEDPHLFHNIHGTDGSGLSLSAEGKTDTLAWDTASTPKKWKNGFGIRGTVTNPSTDTLAPTPFIGDFEGTLFYTSP